MRRLLAIMTLSTAGLQPLALSATELGEPFDSRFLQENKVIDVVISHRFDDRGVAHKAADTMTAEECEKKAEERGEDPNGAYVFEFLEKVGSGDRARLAGRTGKAFSFRLVQLCLIRNPS